MEVNREEKKIVIDGRTFVAEPLHPNFRGEFDCTCTECSLGEHCYKDDEIGFYRNCRKVKCIEHDRESGNLNVRNEITKRSKDNFHTMTTE